MQVDLTNMIDRIKVLIPEWEKNGYISSEGWQLFGENKIIGSSKEENGLEKFNAYCNEVMQMGVFSIVSSLGINEITFTLLSLFEEDGYKDLLGEIKLGNKQLCLCITEDKAGSDMASMSTSAELKDGKYVLNGKKILITNAPVADHFIVAARTGSSGSSWQGISLFLVSKGTKGLKTSNIIKKAGADLMPIGEVEFDNCEIDESCLLGRKNRGFYYLSRVLSFERMMVGLLATIVSEYIHKKFTAYLKERSIFNKHLSEYQTVKVEVAKLYSQVHLNKVLLKKAMADFEENNESKTDVMILKTNTTEVLKKYAGYISQLYGGKGYLADHWASNLYNEIRWTCIAGGANELLYDHLGNDLIFSS